MTEIEEADNSQPFSYRKIIIIGTAYFSVALIDPLYNAYVPLLLFDHLRTGSAVGTTMGLLNLTAPIIIPLFAALSDRTRTSIGKRMPYIIVFLPLAALCLAMIPLLGGVGLFAMVSGLLCLNIFRYAARGPVVSLMPDIIPASQRSQANGVINMMGGFAAITVTVVLSPLVEIELLLPFAGATSRVLPFWCTSIMVVLAAGLVFFAIKEPACQDTIQNTIKDTNQDTKQATNQATNQAARKDASSPISRLTAGAGKLLQAIGSVRSSKQRRAIWIVSAVFAWFMAYRLFNPFITLYVRDVLKAGEAAAARTYGLTAVAQLLFAVPSGIIAARTGRRKTMLTALFLLMVIALGMAGFHIGIVSRIGPTVYPFWGLLFLFGLCWVVMITNCLPMLWEISGPRFIGMYTGLYYLAAQSGAVIGPGFGGIILDTGGFGLLFAAASLVLGCAFFLLLTAGKIIS